MRRAGIALLAATVLASPALAHPVTVEVNAARTMTVPTSWDALVVGNPLIADVSAHGAGVVVITGKSVGMTNVIALDAAGHVVLSKDIVVTTSGGQQLTVQRGAQARQTYFCAPHCAPAPMVGDESTYFDTLVGQRDADISAAERQAEPR